MVGSRSRAQPACYFNGDLFAVADPIELKIAEVCALHEAAWHSKKAPWCRLLLTSIIRKQ